MRMVVHTECPGIFTDATLRKYYSGEGFGVINPFFNINYKLNKDRIVLTLRNNLKMVQLAQKPNSSLSFTWEDLLSLLRDELQEYGSLVGLRNAQQQSILDRRRLKVPMEINQSVQTQMEASHLLQKEGRFCHYRWLHSMGEPSDTSLNQLVEHSPVVSQLYV